MGFSHPDVQIKKYKTFLGHEGEPLAQGEVHFRGRCLAFWSDDSHGGPFRVDAIDAKGRSVPYDQLQEHFRDFEAFARKQLAGQKNFLGEPYDVATLSASQVIEEYLARLSVEYGERHQIERLIKGGAKIAVRRQNGEIYTIATPYTAENVAKLRQTYPDIVEVLNETFGQAFVSEAGEQALKEQDYLRRMRLKCKKHGVFVVLEDGKKVTKISTKPYSQASMTAFRAQYGAAFVECLNERLGVGLA